MIPVPSGVSGARTIEVRHVFAVLSDAWQGSPSRAHGGSAAGAAEVAESRQPPSLSPSFSKFQVVFAKLFQRKLWRFCGISRGCKRSQAIKYRFPNFPPRRPPFAHIPDVPTPHSAARRGYRFQTANRDFQILVLELRHPTRILASLKCSKSTLARISVFPKQNRRAGPVGIENRTSAWSAQGLSRLEAEPERGTGVRAFYPPAVDRDARGFRNRIRDFAGNGKRMSWRSSLVIPMRRVYLAKRPTVTVASFGWGFDEGRSDLIALGCPAFES